VRTEDVETNKALKEGAKVTGAAVVQSEANRYAAEVLIPDLMNSTRQFENDLSILMGRRPGPIGRSSLDAQVPVSSLQTGVSLQLLSNRPDVQAAEYNLRFYFEQTNIARAYFYPSFMITASGGWQSFKTKDLFDYTSLFASLLGGLTQPVFNQGLNKQRLELAKAQYAENLATFQKTVLGAGQEVSDALYSYQSALDKAAIRLKQLKFLQQSVDYTRELLKYGYATYTDVLTSEQSLLAAQISGINDKLQQLTAIVTLYRSLGGGWR
jgi:outer membrane protein TolC